MPFTVNSRVGNADAAIEAWARRALERLRLGGGGASHPAEILEVPVSVQDALAVGKEAFTRLVSLHKDGSGEACLLVSVGLAPFTSSALVSKATEVEAKGIEGFIQDQLDVAVGVSPAGGHFKNYEVVTTPIDESLFKLPILGATAYIRAMRDQEDTEWGVDAVLSYEWAAS